MGSIGINRNIVECKGFSHDSLCLIQTCINRNIVECKGKQANRGNACGNRINRNIVECKVRYLKGEMQALEVLIET